MSMKIIVIVGVSVAVVVGMFVMGWLLNREKPENGVESETRN